MFFDYLNPNEDRPELLIDRAQERAWLKEGFEGYLELCRAQDRRPPGPRVLCLTGAKGSGKSILARSAFHALRKDWSAETLFLEVDCRPLRNSREVLGTIAEKAQEELAGLKEAGAALPKGLAETAGALVELTRFDAVERRQIHEILVGYKGALELDTKRKFLAVLGVSFGISLTREKKERDRLEGLVAFDLPRLVQLLIAFLEDVREAGLSVLLLLDNFDELDHQYGNDSVLERVRNETDWILRLRRAPIGLLFCMRTYYNGIVPRDLTNRRSLGALSAEGLQEVLTRRLQEELEKTQRLTATEKAQTVIERFSDMAPTPLTFLMWFKYVAELDTLDPKRLDALALEYVESQFGTVSLSVLRTLIGAFAKAGGGDPDVSLTRTEVLEAVGGNEALLAQLQDRQVILPRDFWNPNAFTLDPELHWYFHTIRGDQG